MIDLTDTAKISIIITVFSTLIIMITCILYKLSKLREVMDDRGTGTQQHRASRELISIGLPWRRDSNVSSRNSECSICKMEKQDDTAETCNILSHKVTRLCTADHEESVFSGRLHLTIEYRACEENLVVKHVIAEDLLPWRYTSTAKTFVTINFKAGDIQDRQNSEEQTGIYRIKYEREFQFKLCKTDLDHAQFILTVWQTGDEQCSQNSSIGECSVSMDTVPMTSAPEQSLGISRKLFKKSTKKIDTEVLLSLSYLPTAERLSVVVMKAKNIEMRSEETITRNKTTMPNPYVKVCLIYAGRKIKKKKTSVRRHEKNPVYNESMIFDVPANFLHKIGFLVTIEHKNFETEQTTVLGRIVMGSPVHNNALRHWNQMLAFPRRPVAAWHKVFYLG